jgi:aconitate hydratase
LPAAAIPCNNSTAQRPVPGLLAIFPVDDETLKYLRLTGRPEKQIALVETYAKRQGLWHDPDQEAVYSQTVELDLATIEPSIAGPTRPQDRISLKSAQHEIRCLLADQSEPSSRTGPISLDEASAESFPASDPIAITADHVADQPTGSCTSEDAHGWPSDPTPVIFDDGTEASIDHGSVVIAAITSCTNTSNPSVMVAAGLLAKKAVERGLSSKPWVKTSLAPGSRVVTDYYDKSGLTPYLEKLGFNLVGYGCTTCIGNSGPLIPQVSDVVNEHDLNVSAVLSGNRNFEGRIHGQTKMNFLASPPLVIAYALAGSMHVNLTSDPLGQDQDGEPVYLRDIWPTSREVREVVDGFVRGQDVHQGLRRRVRR